MADLTKVVMGLAGLGIGLVVIDKIDKRSDKDATQELPNETEFLAEDKGSKKGLVKQLREIIDRKFTRSDQQEIDTKMSGQTVDIIPQGLSPDFDYSSVFAESKASQYVNMAPMGFGVTDVKIDARNPYDFWLSAEDASYDMSVVGQEAITSPFRPLGEEDPKPTQVSFMSFDTLAQKLSSMPDTSSKIEKEENRFTRAGFSRMGDTKTFSGTYSPDENSDYTSGTATKTLAEWRTQGIINRVTDGMVMLIPRNGGSIKQLRRV